MSPVPRFGRRLRHAMSLWLAAVLVISPVASTAAQTHEAAHAAQGVAHFHGHDATVANDATDSHATGTVNAVSMDPPVQAADEMPDAGAMLHVLAHAAHACGHTVAIVGAVPLAPRAETADQPLVALATSPGDAPRAHPFRPPIA